MARHGLDRRATPAGAAALPLPAAPRRAARSGEQLRRVRCRRAPARWLLVAPPRGGRLPSGCAPRGEPAAWRRLEIAAGEPQVYAATSEEFVAQMLNLDVLGAIAFDKGCYTGQEVIARAHYRGRVKRRMQRFVTRRPRDAGARAIAASCRTGARSRWWTRWQRADGRCEFLAVTDWLAARAPRAGARCGSGASAARRPSALPLPYARCRELAATAPGEPAARAGSFRPHVREQDHIADRGRVGEEHDQAVDADARGPRSGGMPYSSART